MKPIDNLGLLLEYSLYSFCPKATNIIVHHIHQKDDKCTLSLEVWYKIENQLKIKFANLVI